MLTEMGEYDLKIEEEVKAMISEIKENVQKTNSEGKETRTQINGLDQKKEINIQPEHNDETRMQKNEERHKNLPDKFKHSNIWIIGVPEGEEEKQEIENLFEQIMKENFPNLVKEIDFQEVQEVQRVSKTLDPRKHTPRRIIITLGKIKDKKRILKAAVENYLQRSSRKTLSWFLKGNLAGKKRLGRSIQDQERQGPISKITLSSKLSFRMEGQIKSFWDKVKLSEFIITKPLLYEMLKGLI